MCIRDSSSALYHLLVPQPDANYHWISNILVTFKEYIISFAVTIVGGIALAVLIVWSKTVQNILMPAFVDVYKRQLQCLCQSAAGA